VYSKLILTTVSNEERYVNLLKVFLYTLEKYGGNYPVVADVINGTDELADGLKRLHLQTEIRNISIPKAKGLDVMYSRPPQMLKYLKEGHEAIASIDADVIFRKDVSGLWDGVVPNSVKFWDKGMTPPISKKMKDKRFKKKYMHRRLNRTDLRFQGGVFIIGNGEHAIKYQKRMIDCLPSKPAFYTWQTGMFTMLKRMKSTMRSVRMSPVYNDSCFNSKSKNYFDKYLALANEVING
jgi:hypothetical protein